MTTQDAQLKYRFNYVFMILMVIGTVGCLYYMVVPPEFLNNSLVYLVFAVVFMAMGLVFYKSNMQIDAAIEKAEAFKKEISLPLPVLIDPFPRDPSLEEIGTTKRVTNTETLGNLCRDAEQFGAKWNIDNDEGTVRLHIGNRRMFNAKLQREGDQWHVYFFNAFYTPAVETPPEAEAELAEQGALPE